MTAITQALVASADGQFRRDTCAALLEQDNIDVTGAVDNAGALWRSAEVLQPQVILLDMQWLSGDPVVLIDGLRAACPHAKLLLFFDMLDHERLVTAALHGAQGCVVRTCATTEWLQAVRAMLAGDIWIKRSALFAAMRDGGRVRHADPLAHKLAALTPREREVVTGVRDGLSNKQIARQLAICPTTVRTHLQHIFGKLDIHSRFGLLARVL